MLYLRKWIPRYRTASWLLVTALLVQLVAQLHLHLHHADISLPQGHEHIVDYHMLADDHPGDHPAHKNAHEIKSSPLVIVKKVINSDLGIILSACLLLLLPTVVQLIIRRNLLPDVFTKSQYYQLSPPLRAPPAA